MRLLNINTLKLELFHDVSQAPKYTILSHQWGKEEVLFEDLQDYPEQQELAAMKIQLEAMSKQLQALQAKVLGLDAASANPPVNDQDTAQSSLQATGSEAKKYGWMYDSNAEFLVHYPHLERATRKAAWSKVLGCCHKAKKFSFDYVWIDTICIDKTSSSELSESINSMFNWYNKASLCFAYLQDVSTLVTEPDCGEHCFTKSEWWTRGWTLQELIAPRDVLFFRKDWGIIGMRNDLHEHIASKTGISLLVVGYNSVVELKSISVAARMSWAAQRKTTRAEDRAYSLMGLFGVNMPTLYGEGLRNAFFRLQVEIGHTIHDESLLAWSCPQYETDMPLLAPDPSVFLDCKRVTNFALDVFKPQLDAKSSPWHDFSGKLSNAFLRDTAVHSSLATNSVLKFSLLLVDSGWKGRGNKPLFHAVLGCQDMGATSSKNPLSVLIRLSPGGLRYVRTHDTIYLNDPNPLDTRAVSEFNLNSLWSGKMKGKICDIPIMNFQLASPVRVPALKFQVISPSLLEAALVDYDSEQLKWLGQDAHPVKLWSTPNSKVYEYRFQVAETGEKFCVMLSNDLYEFGRSPCHIFLYAEEGYNTPQRALNILSKENHNTKHLFEYGSHIRSLRDNRVVTVNVTWIGVLVLRVDVIQ